MRELRIAVVGDIHTHFGDDDVRYFNQSEYDVLLFVGDLPDRKLWQVNAEARKLARVRKPMYCIPGNHDALTLLQLVGEFFGNPLLIRAGAPGHKKRVDRLREALSPAILCGYSWHPLPAPDEPIGLVVGRPHSMGGGLNVAPYLAEAFAVYTLEQSGQRICRLIDEVPYSRLILMAHHGPSGLGDHPTDPWGCDFKKGGGDWGDPDLKVAVDYALANGRELLAVIAGHMHYPTKSNRRHRRWYAHRGGTHFVNAARVPRIQRGADGARHHHISLEIGESCRVHEVWVTPRGESFSVERVEAGGAPEASASAV
ncbi:MAG: metallophosphoesterase [Myxococcales bacterium]|nr:metallophosphoesterase [Myxococcales bacterium]